MKIVGLMPVRNEDWCLGLSLRVALLWCDEVVVLLHACTDRSAEIALEVAQEHNPRVTIVADHKELWDEMRHRQALLELARSQEIAATHIATIDADEILTGNLLPGAEKTTLPRADWQHDAIRQAVRSTQAGSILQLPGYNLRGSLTRYHQNGIWGNRWFSTAFQDDPRLGWSGDRFHAREPQGVALQPYRPVQQGQGGILHLWGASERRLIAKHAWYKITERLRWPNKSVQGIDETYNQAVYGVKKPAIGWDISGPSALVSKQPPPGWPGPPIFATVPEPWWAPYALLMGYLDLDAVPWQEAESRRLYAEHGAAMFAGLDLFGVCG